MCGIFALIGYNPSNVLDEKYFSRGKSVVQNILHYKKLEIIILDFIDELLMD